MNLNVSICAVSQNKLYILKAARHMQFSTVRFHLNNYNKIILHHTNIQNILCTADTLNEIVI